VHLELGAGAMGESLSGGHGKWSLFVGLSFFDLCFFLAFQHEDHSMAALRLGRGTGAVQIADKKEIIN
jgi:hypothetical protein